MHAYGHRAIWEFASHMQIVPAVVLGTSFEFLWRKSQVLTALSGKLRGSQNYTACPLKHARAGTISRDGVYVSALNELASEVSVRRRRAEWMKKAGRLLIVRQIIFPGRL